MHPSSSQQTVLEKLEYWADQINPKQSFFIKKIRSVVKVLLITSREFTKNDLSLRSAALTYTVMLSLVPMLAMSTAVVKGMGGGDQIRKVVYTYLDTLEENNKEISKFTGAVGIEQNSQPAQTDTDSPADSGVDSDGEAPQGQNTGLTSQLRSGIDQLFDYVDRTNFATLGTFGVAGILLSIIIVFSNIEKSMNSIWHVTKSRPLMRKISDYLTLLFLMPISSSVAFGAGTVLSSQSLSSKLDIIMPFAWMQTLLFKFIPIFFIAVSLYIIYLFFPNTKVRNRPAFISALFAATLWFLAQNAYINLQVGVSKYNAIYGSFATLPLLLLWIYFGWVFILSGAQLGYAIQKRNEYPLVIPPSIPSVILSGAFDILEDVYDLYESGKDACFDSLIQNYPEYTPDVMKESLQKLLDGKLLHKVENTLLIPAVPRNLLSRKDIIEAVLGDFSGTTRGGEISRAFLTETDKK